MMLGENMTRDDLMTQDALLELVAASRTYRRFDESRPVAREELVRLVGAARLAPTANNTQQLRFHVSVGEEAFEVMAHHRWAGLLKDWDGPALGERPTGYITIAAPAGTRMNPLRNQDAGIAAQTIMLAARAAGLAGCMVASFDAGLSELLGLAEKGLEPLLTCALGYPAADERVVLEEAGAEHGLAYWRDADNTHHVPKLPLEDLLA